MEEDHGFREGQELMAACGLSWSVDLKGDRVLSGA